MLPGRLIIVLISLLHDAPLTFSNEDCAWSMCGHSSFQKVVDTTPSMYRLEFFKCDRSTQRVGSTCWNSNPDLQQSASKVSHFSLTKVDLTYFPSQDLCRFTNLKVVNLERNLITEFVYPGDSCLVKTQHIILRENRLRHVNLTEFLRLPNLEDLDLDENIIEDIFVTQIPFHTVLRRLTARKSNIHTVDMSLIRILTLSFVDFSANEITSISNRLRWKWKQSVDSIGIERSKLIRSDNTFTKDLTLLIKSNNFSDPFSHNRLWGLDVGEIKTYQDEDFSTNSQQHEVSEQVLYKYMRSFEFVKIQAEGSSVSCNCRAIEAYRFFSRHLNEALRQRLGLQGLDFWLNLPCNHPSEAAGFQLLRLAPHQLVCELRKDCPSACRCTEHVHPEYLTKVNCSGSRIAHVPKQLPRAQMLSPYDVYLADNGLTELQLLPYPQDIQRLLLNDNLLNENSDFTSLLRYRNLKMVDLRRNELHSLPDTLLKLMQQAKAPNMLLEGNPLQCDCATFVKQRVHQLPFYMQLNCFDENNERYRILDYKTTLCQVPQQTLLLHNNTSVVYRDRAASSPLYSQWLLVGVAILSGLLITALLLVTGVVFCRFVMQTQRRHAGQHLMATTTRNSYMAATEVAASSCVASCAASVADMSKNRSCSLENNYNSHDVVDCTRALLLANGCKKTCVNNCGSLARYELRRQQHLHSNGYGGDGGGNGADYLPPDLVSNSAIGVPICLTYDEPRYISQDAIALLRSNSLQCANYDEQKRANYESVMDESKILSLDSSHRRRSMPRLGSMAVVVAQRQSQAATTCSLERHSQLQLSLGKKHDNVDDGSGAFCDGVSASSMTTDVNLNSDYAINGIVDRSHSTSPYTSKSPTFLTAIPYINRPALRTETHVEDNARNDNFTSETFVKKILTPNNSRETNV